MHATNRLCWSSVTKGIAARHGFDIVIPCHYVATINAACIITINGPTRARRSHQRRRYNLTTRYNLKSRNYINKSHARTFRNCVAVLRVHCSETPELMNAAAVIGFHICSRDQGASPSVKIGHYRGDWKFPWTRPSTFRLRCDRDRTNVDDEAQ